jgi:methylmalonyl-CoA/ethylmalonyl-CoA epimerase
MEKIEHIGIAVHSLNKSIPLFEKLLGTECYKTEEILSEMVNTAFFKTGESKVELLEGTEENSVISRFIAKKGEGIHHIAFGVENIEEEINRLKLSGFEFINDVPKKGADNKMVCFLHPKTTNGILVELCQDINAEH